MKEKISKAKGLKALSPLFVFLGIYTGMSVWLGDFYAVPIVIPFLVASLYSFAVQDGLTLEQRIDTFVKGASQHSIMLMVLIFILAGAFASTAKEMGAIDATVNLTQWLLPDKMFLSGLFIASCFISLSVGTSVGTITALTPLACGIAERTGESTPLLVAVVVGGAFFGDNLSFISDTTIVATRTQGCELKDKFKYNLRLAVPAAAICLLVYSFMSNAADVPVEVSRANFWLVLPYLFIIISALMGMNVLLLLASGTLIAGVIGFLQGEFDIVGYMAAINKGVLSMGELIVVTFLAGGMIEVLRKAGGIDFLMQSMSSRIRSKRGAELSIASLVVFTDFCTANNTIAILSVGSLAKEISLRFGIDPRRCASILDTFSCMAQGIIPYGAQLLIASYLSGVTPIDIIPYLFYPFILGIVSLLYIIFKK